MRVNPSLVLRCVIRHLINGLYIIVSFNFFSNVGGATHRLFRKCGGFILLQDLVLGGVHYHGGASAVITRGFYF